MIEIQAAIGRLQLRKLDGWVEKRREHADRFNKAFASLPALRLTIPPAEIYHSYYKYYMFVRPEMLKSDWSRDRIMEEVNAAGVPCFSGSCSEIYLEKAFEAIRKMDSATARRMTENGEIASSPLAPRNDGGNGEVPGPENRLPVARELGETSLMLLVHPTLTEQNIEDTIRVVKDVICRATK